MKFVESLTEEQREELEALRRTGATHRQRNRAHAVLLSAQGYSIGQLAAILGGERDAVGRWLAAWREGGAGALADRPKSGRPARLATPGAEATLLAAVASAPANPEPTVAEKGG